MPARDSINEALPRGGSTAQPADLVALRSGFRDAMANLSSAVCVVTSDGPAGRVGFTATAVCSVSDDPPTLLVCMNRNSAQNRALQDNGVLCVNALGAHQQHLSSLFAGGSQDMAERFAAATWSAGPSGSPNLESAVSVFDCRIAQVLEVGTHSVLFAAPLRVRTRDDVALVYFGRNYHHLKPVDASFRD